MKEEFELGGFQIKVAEHADEYGEPDHLGRFTDTWEEGAIAHRQKSRYGGNGECKWYIPAESVETIRQALSDIGYSKSEAERDARAQIQSDYELADSFGHEWHYNTIVVTASRCGVELGQAAMGGVESNSDDDYIESVVEELADEAIDEAKDKLDELLNTVSPLKHLALCAEED